MLLLRKNKNMELVENEDLMDINNDITIKTSVPTIIFNFQIEIIKELEQNILKTIQFNNNTELNIETNKNIMFNLLGFNEMIVNYYTINNEIDAELNKYGKLIMKKLINNELEQTLSKLKYYNFLLKTRVNNYVIIRTDNFDIQKTIQAIINITNNLQNIKNYESVIYNINFLLEKFYKLN